MGRRIIAIGTHVGAAGARVFSVGMHLGTIFLAENPGFAWATQPHHFYEVADVGDYREQFAVFYGNIPLGSQWPGGGTYWVPCSSHPPGLGVWPHGYAMVELTTRNPQAGGYGTMRVSGGGARVYRAADLLIWIPTAALGVGNIPLPTLSEWTVDF